ncbi:putative camk family protein kinase [Phaeomoniella chlamydospora]|uniref:non-specific serine/threonine protein kinase n=1 Tax=Phaeomoniella chlamydospora TaxID=158046 RepID=A0A0G2GJT3_PHACM|nr:putative camk family protein kinase [Phaeomoniella chlamydospora]
MQEQVQESKRQFLERPKNPAYAITADDSDTPASRYETRLQTPWDSGTRLAHRKLDTLGHGSFGIVHKAVDMHSGEHLAVKSIRLNPRQRNDYSRKTIKREVEILHGLFHPHLAEFRHSQGFQHDDDNVEIFMTLYDGNLEHLLHERPEFPQEKALIRELFRQTLSAVVYLAHKSILHRDIKPANILFSENCHWVLADFGLAKFQDEGLTRAGSGHFMAPEILSGGRQTHKVDVYSLGMTMLYSLSSHDLRQRIHGAEPLRESPDFQTALGRLSRLNALLREDPEQRSTAQQIYLGFFGDDPEILSQPPAEIPEPVSVNIFAEAARVQAPTTLGRQQPFGKRLLLNQRKIRKEARRRAAGLQD